MKLGILKFKIAKVLGFVKTEIIPSMEEKRAVMEEYRKTYNPVYFIETGTFLGDTTEFFKNKFQKIYSIELSEDLYTKAKKRFASHSHVQIVHGDSGKLFHTLLPTLEGTALFWLDGHYSSEFYIGDEFIKTAKGEKDTPVMEELKAVCKYCLGRQIILIDDARLFKGTQDYPSIQELKQTLNRTRRPYMLKVDTDIVQILLD